MWIDSSARIVLHAARQLTTNGSAIVATPKRPLDPSMQHALVWTWLSLNITAQVLLSVLLGTFLFSRRLRSQRHPVLLNFVVTWLLATLPACLLLYGGGAEGPEPDPGLCLYNAAAIAGVPPMVALSFFAVVVQFFVMARTVVAQKEYVRRTWLTVLLIAAPYLAFIGFALMTGIIGFLNPADVNRDSEVVFCSVSHHHLALLIWGPTVGIVAVTLALGVALVVLLWRHWRDVQGNSIVDFQLIVRALCFAVFQLFLLATFVLSIFDQDLVPRFMQAAAPLVVFLIFSTQPDVLRSWFFCIGRKDKPAAARTSALPPPPNAQDEERAMWDYSFQTTTSSEPPAMRGVPGLRIATEGLPSGAPPSTRTSTPASGLRPLMLGTSVTPSPMRVGAMSHSYSPSKSPTIILRPEFSYMHHGRNASTSDRSTLSDFSVGSTGSGAPLLRSVEELRLARPVEWSGAPTYPRAAALSGPRPGNKWA